MPIEKCSGFRLVPYGGRKVPAFHQHRQLHAVGRTLERMSAVARSDAPGIPARLLGRPRRTGGEFRISQAQIKYSHHQILDELTSIQNA